jgi:hypothetical protein
MKIGDLIQVRSPVLFDEMSMFGLIVDAKKTHSQATIIVSGSDTSGNFYVLWFDGEFSWESKKCLEMIRRQVISADLILSSTSVIVS